MTSKPTSSALPEQTAFDRRRAASSLGCRSDHSYKTLFFQAIYQQRGDIVQSLPVEQILPFIDSVDAIGRTPLIHSVSLGDLNTCRILLQLGCDVNKTDETMWTALHHAAEGGYEDIFKLLLDNKANPDCRTTQKYTPLHIAISNKRIGIISILQSMDIRIDYKDTKGRTPLNLAIENKMTWKTISKLLDMRADPNIHNKRDENPVLLAAILGRFKMACWIIMHAKIPFNSYNCRDRKGQTLLHAAVEKNLNLDIFKTFLRGDFDLNVVNPQGKSPLLAALELGYVHIAEELIIAGADINQSDPYGKTPLYVAAREGHEGIILALFIQGTPVSYCQDPFLPTALHVAIFKKHKENLIYALLLSEDELEMRNIYGQTPLLLAMLEDNVHLVNVLVKSGAKVDVADIDGVTPIEILKRSINLKLFAAYVGELDSYKMGNTGEVLRLAIKGNMVKYVETLLQNDVLINYEHIEEALELEKGDKENIIPNVLLKNMKLSRKKYTAEFKYCLSLVIIENNAGMIYKMFQSDIRDYVQETLGYNTAIVDAIYKGKLEVAEALFETGWDPTYDNENEGEVKWALAKNQSMKELCSKYDFRMENRKKLIFGSKTKTALMEYVIEIISSGKGLSDFDANGDTVLHIAAESSDFATLEYLINNGIDINIQNRYDQTALHLAVNHRFMDGVEFLLAHGADLNIKDYLDRTPLWCSTVRNYFELSLKLLAAGASTTSPKDDKNFAQRAVEKGNVGLLKEVKTPNLMARDVYYIKDIENEQSKEEMLEYFISAFRDGDKNGENVLFGALYNKDLDLMKNILRLDSSLVNSVNQKTEESLLHIGLDVFEKNEFSRLLLLIEEYGGDLDKVRYKLNETPLEKCIKYERLVEAALLVSIKADCTQNAISLANTKNQELLVQMMVDAGATPPPQWPKQVLSLEKIAIIACRKYIPQKGFRRALESLEISVYVNSLLLKDHFDKIEKRFSRL